MAYSLGDIKNQTWHLQVKQKVMKLSSATEGKGLAEGLNWITDRLVGEGK